MNAKRLAYKISYTWRNFYNDHRYIVYLPIFILLGIILGISFAAKHEFSIANFIDLCSNDEYNFSLVFFREILLYIVVLIGVAPCLINRYFHILGIASLVLVGYRFGYTMAGIVIGNTFTGIITILIINIPFVLVASMVLCLFYASVSSIIGCQSYLRRSRFILLGRYVIIYSIIYVSLVIVFHIVIPKTIILIFL